MGTLYERITTLCKEKGVSGSRMCLELGLSKSTLSDMKHGRTKGVSTATAQKIASYFGVTVGYLLGEEEKASDVKSNAIILDSSDTRKMFPINLSLFDGRSEEERETEKKLLALYDKIEDKEGLIKFMERLSALSEEQQKFVFENLLQGR